MKSVNDIPVGMYRPHMDDIPIHQLPEGHSFRSFHSAEFEQSDDTERWVAIQAAANATFMKIAMDTFQNDFGGFGKCLADRSWFVVSPEGKDIASITAWWRDTPDGPQGLIHWVAVLPECQGRGIGKAIMTKAMLRLKDEYRNAYLNTSSARLPAIKVYLDFGFLPDMEKDRAKEGWAEVRQHLKHPALGNG
jgi:ribosomal protein S18 acetylase RimI-like enzyme